MKITRDMDATRINEIINTPGIYEWVHGAIVGKLDLTDLLKQPQHVCLIGEHGGILFNCLQPGLYDVHTNILEPGRGPWAIEFVQSALHYMFCKTDALELFSRVPCGNIGARALVKSIGGKLEFRRENSWVMDHKPIASDVYSLKVQDWMRDTAVLKKKGKWFHKRLVDEYLKAGKLDLSHDDDENHDQFVGGAVEMIMGGQPYKAAILYNRWAAISGYAPIQVVMDKPLLVNIQEAVLHIQGNDFKVVQCL